MRIVNLLFMIVYCLLGILKIRTPTSITIFVDTLIILILIYWVDKNQEGWGNTLKAWGRILKK